MEPDYVKPSLKSRLVGHLLNVPFPAGLAVIAFGIGMISVAPGVIAGGLFICLIGYLTER